MIADDFAAHQERSSTSLGLDYLTFLAIIMQHLEDSSDEFKSMILMAANQ